MEHIRKEESKARKGEDILKLRLKALDRFQFCLAACRTSSASVRHENTYKNPHSKHCYNLHVPSRSHNDRRSQRDLASFNNNNDDAKVVLTSSSVIIFLKPLSFPFYSEASSDLTNYGFRLG